MVPLRPLINNYPLYPSKTINKLVIGWWRETGSITPDGLHKQDEGECGAPIPCLSKLNYSLFLMDFSTNTQVSHLWCLIIACKHSGAMKEQGRTRPRLLTKSVFSLSWFTDQLKRTSKWKVTTFPQAHLHLWKTKLFNGAQQVVLSQ